MTVKADPKFWECPTIDSVDHIKRSLGEKLFLPEDIDCDEWMNESLERLEREFSKIAKRPIEHVKSWNTYNQDNDLSQQINFAIFAPVDCADWCWADDTFVVTELHLGGDVRGNYGPFSAYRVDNIGETGFLDVTAGWYATPVTPDATRDACEALEAINGRLGTGYSEWPTGELRKALIGKSEPAWVEALGCYVGRLANVPFPVRLEPTEPCYG